MRTKFLVVVLLLTVLIAGAGLVLTSDTATKIGALLAAALAAFALGTVRKKTNSPADMVPRKWLESIPHPVFIKDGEGKFIFVNRAYEQFYGKSAREVVGRQSFELQPQERAKLFVEQDESARRSPGVVQRVESIFEPIPGQVRLTQVAKVAVTDGTAQLLLCTAADISDLRQYERDLLHSEQRLEIVMKASQQGVIDLAIPDIAAVDVDGTEHYLSEQARRLLRLNQEPVGGYEQVFASLDEAERTQLLQELKLFLVSRQELFTTEFQIANGNDRAWIRLQGLAIRGLKDVATRFIGSLTDITAIRKGELALIAQTKLLADVIEMSPSAIFLKDADGIWRMVNQAWEKIAAQDRTNVIGRRSRDFQRPEVADQNEAQDLELLGSEDGFLQRRIIFHNRLGQFYDAVITKRVIREPDGKIWGIIGTVLDLTERFKLERQVTSQRELLDLVIRSADFGIWDQDKQSSTFFSSPRYNAILGYSDEDDVSFDGLEGLAHPDDRGSVQLAFEQLKLGQAQRFATEFRARKKNGDYVWVEAQGMAVFDEANQLKRFVGSINDISLRKQRESELKVAIQSAQQAATAKASFLSTMSHEIRTPLNGVIGSASLLESTQLEPDQRRFVETIQTSADALLAVISDVLDFSKIDSGLMTFEATPVRLDELCEKVVEIVAEKARSKRVEIYGDVESSAPAVVLLDATRVRQILLNLMGNAVKFTEQGFVAIHVRVIADQISPKLNFVVSDTGIGIEPEQMLRIFEPFVQGDSTTTRRFGGTGLGLAIAKKLATLMDGDLVVKSSSGQGSQFTLSVPLVTAPVQTSPSAPSLGVDVSETSIALCVPLPGLRQAIERMMNAWRTTVTVFDSPADLAVTAANGGRWDAIVIDMDQPPQEVNRCLSRLPLQYVVGLSHQTSSQLQTEFAAHLPFLASLILKPVRKSQLYNAIISARQAVRSASTSIGMPSLNRRAFVDSATRQNDQTIVQTAKSLVDTQEMTVLAKRSGSVSDEFAHTPKSLSGLQVLVAEDNTVNQIIIQEMMRRAKLRPKIVSDGLQALKYAVSGLYPIVVLDINMPEKSGLDVARELVEQLPKNNRPYMIALTAHALTGDKETCLAAGLDDYMSKPLQASQLISALRKAERELLQRTAWRGHMQPYEAGLLGDVLDVSRLEELHSIAYQSQGPAHARRFVVELIDSFERKCNEGLTQLEGLVPAFETFKAQQVTHMLVGSSSNIGGRSMAVELKNLEQALRERDLPQAAKVLGRMRPLFQQTVTALRHWHQNIPDMP